MKVKIGVREMYKRQDKAIPSVETFDQFLDDEGLLEICEQDALKEIAEDCVD